MGPVSVCDGATKVLTAADAFVDDFEEAYLSLRWTWFNDVMPVVNAFPLTQALGGAVGTDHSARYVGGGAVTPDMGGFGVGLIYDVAIDPIDGIHCADITAFDGVSFWAKGALAGDQIALNFVIPQTNLASTDAQGRPNGGDCTSQCFNHPYATVTLNRDWTQYAVRFSDAAGGDAKVGELLQELAWLSPESNWEYWIDEVAFYKGSPPVGPVAKVGSASP